ncbi:type IV pili methyl-accepting chemotaxis transducer N-terminal domain-containing protein [Candidatus Endoriftia persephone]|nr:type IV pili methyl-accepting chemotaxis transducer N-terminal domain-containing protein [Candidatus Endoriftia persephone]USF86292.1 type IV pili methyl-accepting chemotaxis transducer N-terminal domain-containing protein [Candidatus Endoriftia persephone]
MSGSPSMLGSVFPMTSNMFSRPFLLMAWLTAGILLFTQSTQAAIKDSTDAINKAGMQRMLTQRMLMDYALIGQGIKYQQPGADLKETIALFERHLQELTAFPVNDEVNKALKAVTTQWHALKPVLTATPDRNQAASLRDEMDRLLDASHRLVSLIAAASTDKSAEIVNRSGRQRMLSQRMASLYMLRSWRIEGFDFAPAFKQAVDEFKANHAKLEHSSLTTPDIKKQLNIANKAFQWFDLSAKTNSDKFIPSLILRSSNRILDAMNNATKMYAEK